MATRRSSIAHARRGPELGRVVAALILFLLTFVGVTAVALPFVFQMPSVRARIEHEVSKVVKDETGLDVKLHIDRALWPPGVRVRDIEIASTDPKKPFAKIGEARVTLRPFALLSGRVVLDTIEVIAPDVDADIMDGQLVNLPLHLKPHPPSPKTNAIEPPFRTVAVTNAKLHAHYRDKEGNEIATTLVGVDVDVDVAGEGTPVYEARLHKAAGAVHSSHLQENRLPLPDRYAPKDKTKFAPVRMIDDDAICAVALSARMTDAPTARIIELKRLELDVRLDDDGQSGTVPSCAAGAVSDDRVLSLRVDGVDLELPKEGAPKKRGHDPAPVLSMGKNGGRLRVRAPLRLPYRYVTLEPVEGWVSLDTDTIATIDFDDPMTGIERATLGGRIEAHDIRFAQFHFGTLLAGDVAVHPPLIVTSKKLDVDYGGGAVTLTDVEARLAPAPLAKKKLPLKATVAIKDLPFPGLMRELAVSKAAHVRWDFHEANAKVAGFLDPLQLDGDLVAHTKNFELAQGPVEKPAHGHIIGLSPKTNGNADVTAKVVIRADHLGFEGIHATFGASRAEGRVHIGFDDRFEVDVTSDQLDIADGSPLTTFALAGVGKFDMKLRGTFEAFKAEGSASFGGFVFDQFALGDIESANYRFNKDALIEIDSVKAKHGDSRYDVPSMRIDLGRPVGVVIDALAKSSNMSLDDLYAILKLTGDPRWEDIKGHAGFDARAHFVTGTSDDPCRKGRLDVDLTANVLALDLFGERYDGGTGDVSFSWFDLDGGGLGMDLDLHAATLRKKGGGTITASGTIRRGGNLNVKVTASGVTLSGLSAMPATTIPIDGTVDAVAEVGGTFDTMKIVADVFMSPLRIGDHLLDRSKLRVVREPLPIIEPSLQPDAKGCYKKTDIAPFDPAKWASDPVTGEYVMTGEMFGGTVKFDDFRLTDSRKKVARGKVALRGLDLAPLSLVRMQTAGEALGEQPEKATAPTAVAGKASADITLESYPLDAWWDSVGRVDNLTVDVERGDLAIATVAPTPTLTFGKTGLSLPQTTLSLRFGELPTKVVLAAKVVRHEGTSKSPDLAVSIDLPYIPLKRLEEFLPKYVERAEGVGRARLRVGGTLETPTWDGEIAVQKGAFTFRQFGMPLVGVNGVIRVDPKKGITIDKLHGELGGGTLDVSGGAALKGAQLGDLDVKLAARGVNLRYGEGLTTTFDADVRTTWSPTEPGQATQPAHVEGVVELDSFLYEKRMGQVAITVGGAKRTEVEAYDPARDLTLFDIEIKSKHGFRVRNNLVDATLGIGQGGLRVVGSNQRWGVLGELFVQKGGVFKYRRHDFEIREGALRFEDDTKIDPNIDVTAVTNYRRAGGTGSAVEWNIKLHAYGTKDDLKFDLTSDPPLSQEDLLFLLTIGMTKAESAQIGGNVAGGAGLDLLANVTGVNDTLSQAIPVIDDIRFGTAYNLRTGRTEPQVTFGKRLADALRASVTSGFSEQRTIQANIEWQISRQFSLQGSYDNVNDVSSTSIGNVGVDLRYRIEFE